MDIDEEAIDAIRELINIGVGKAAGLLSEMTGCRIILKVPAIRITRITDLSTEVGPGPQDNLATVALSFRGSMSGLTALVFPPDSAASLVMLLTGEKTGTAELDAIRVETLREVGNIIINAVMGSIANILEQHLTYALPTYQETTLSSLAGSRKKDSDDWVVLAETRFVIENMPIEGNLLLIFEVGSIDTLVAALKKSGT